MDSQRYRLSQEMMHPKWQEEEEEEGTENDVAEGASLGRQVLLPASSPICVRTSTATTLLDDGRTSVFHINFFVFPYLALT